jgi:DNA-binding NarL/FixJ family response regulator
MAQAAPGEVIVSSTVTDLVAGSGIAFEELDVRLILGGGDARRLYRVTNGPAGTQVAPPSSDAPAAGSDQQSGRLTHREREIAALVARGQSNRAIADSLSISVKTVERHVANIMIKLGCHARSQVAVWMVEHVRLPDPTG